MASLLSMGRKEPARRHFLFSFTKITKKIKKIIRKKKEEINNFSSNELELEKPLKKMAAPFRYRCRFMKRF